MFYKEARNTQWGKKASSTNGAGQTGWLYVEENPSRSIIITLHKSQRQMDQRPQHKIRYTEPDRREIGNRLKLIYTRKRLSVQNTVSTGTKINNY